MNVAWAVVVVVLAAACGGKQSSEPTAPPPAATGSASVAAPTEPAPAAASSAPACAAGETKPACFVRVFRYFRDQVCACADAACAERVGNDMSAWSMEVASKFDGTEESSPEAMEEMNRIANEFGDCASKLNPDDSARAEGEYRMEKHDEPPTYKRVRSMPIGKAPARKPACAKQDTAAQCSLTMMGYFAEAMCACPERTCGERVSRELQSWAEEWAKTANQAPTPDEATMKKMEQIGNKFGDCATDVLMTDPNAE